MNVMFHSLGDLVAGDGYLMTLTLMAVCATLWVLVLERAAVLGDAPWEKLVPSLREKRALAHGRFNQAFQSYIARPTEGGRAALAACAESLPTPVGLYCRRVFAGTAGARRAGRELGIDGAAFVGQREVYKGLDFARALARAALFLGLVAATGGLARSLWTMSTNGVHVAESWSAGLSTALMGSQLAFLVGIPGGLAAGWLSRRAEKIVEEIDTRRLMLLRALDASPEVTP